MAAERFSPHAIQRIHDLDQLAAKIEQTEKTGDVTELRKKYEKAEQFHKFMLKNEKESLLKTGRFPTYGA